MSWKTTLGKALVFLVLEIGALTGVPMDPNRIEELMQVMKRNTTVSERQRDGDDDWPPWKAEG